MKAISIEELATLKFKEKKSKQKSANRLAVEALEEGQAIKLEQGTDYKTTGQVYSMVKTISNMQDKKFIIKELEDSSGMVVGRSITTS